MRLSMKLLAMTAALGAAAAVVAQGPTLAMLSQLQRGQWTVTPDDGGPARRICLGSTVQLVQFRHGGAKCSRIIAEDQPNKVTVQYTCRGNGYGRTTIRRETDTLVQIESQGVAGGRPFQFRAEARRTGTCR